MSSSGTILPSLGAMGHRGQDNAWWQQLLRSTTGTIAVFILGTCVSTSQPMLTPYASMVNLGHLSVRAPVGSYERAGETDFVISRNEITPIDVTVG